MHTYRYIYIYIYMSRYPSSPQQKLERLTSLLLVLSNLCLVWSHPDWQQKRLRHLDTF